LAKKDAFFQKTCFRLVGISVERKNKSVPSVWVFLLISSNCPQNIQESGLKTKVQIIKGRTIKLGKTAAKKSLMLLIFKLMNLVVPKVLFPIFSSTNTNFLPRNHPVFSLTTNKKKATITTHKSRIIQVLVLLKTLFQK